MKKHKLFDRHDESKYKKNVILSRSEGSHNNQILRSLYSLRMTGDRTVPSLTKREGNKKHKELINLSTYPLINFKPAFTLAEVLITLGIIGVVAAITIPMLIQNNQAAKLRSQYLKSYSVVSQALRLMENDDVSTNPRDYTRTYFYKNFAKYLTNTTDCGGATGSASSRPDGCYSYKISGEYTEGYKLLDGRSYVRDGLFNNGQLMLPDGTLIFFDDGPVSEGWKGVPVYVDINGYKNKPNRLGYDFFAYEIVDGVLYAMGDVNSTYPDNKNDEYCKGGYFKYSGFTCAIRAKNNSEYFKQVVKNFK